MENKKKSKLGGVAIFLSLIPVIHLFGLLLAIIDLAFRHKKVRINRAVTALIISCIWTGAIGYVAYPLVSSYIQVVNEIQGPSRLVSKTLIPVESNEDGVLFTTVTRVTKIKGKADFDDTPEQIKYRLMADENYELQSGEMEYRSNWSIKIKGLAYGVNLLEVTYIYNDITKNRVFNYVIYNTNTGNVKRLHLEDIDSDGDGLNDLFELNKTLTDPNNPDTDGNGISDADEDNDNDGLTNIEEQEAGTNPQYKDTDHDGLNDIDELKQGTDPLNADTDGDGYEDGFEIEIGTNPLDKNDPKKGVEISYTKTIKLDNDMTVSINVKTLPENIETLYVFPIPTTYDISPDNIEGMIGTGLTIGMDEQPIEAQISITLDDNDYIDGENYYLYYYNDDTCIPEYVEKQNQTGNTITASLPHFSRYFISTYDKEKGNDVYGKYGIKQVTNENRSFLFESYEDYVSTIYPNKSVLSMNICTGNINKPVALSNTDLSAGHSWISYYYNGNETNLKLNVIDKQVSTDTKFGTIGYGGWINACGFPLYLLKAWDGSLKLPTGYRELYSNGVSDESGNIIYQSKTKPYTDINSDFVIRPENMQNAFISMPFVINENELKKAAEFINTYKEPYDLNKNNCTTFVHDMMEQAGIQNNIDTKYKANGIHISNIYTKDAGSPGQASYSIQQEYPDEYVYVLEEILDDGSSKLWFTSKRAQAGVSKSEQAKIAKMEEETKVETITNANELLEPEQSEPIFTDDTSGFIVFGSPFGTYFGLTPVIIIEETELLPDESRQQQIRDYLNKGSDKTKYLYYQIPKIVADQIRTKYIRDEYQFTNTEAYNKKDYKSYEVRGFLWRYWLQLCYVSESETEFYYNFIGYRYMY